MGFANERGALNGLNGFIAQSSNPNIDKFYSFSIQYSF